VHDALVILLRDQKLAAERAPQTVRQEPEPFLCFQRRAAGDVVVGDFKVLGSAQRRRQGALLQHGSLLLGRSAAAPELPGLRELGCALEIDQIREQWLNQLGSRWQPKVQFMTRDWLTSERERVGRIEEEKFASSGWTLRRR
jgi:lipoyl(octanoyl) transferase